MDTVFLLDTIIQWFHFFKLCVFVHMYADTYSCVGACVHIFYMYALLRRQVFSYSKVSFFCLFVCLFVFKTGFLCSFGICPGTSSCRPGWP